MSFVKLPRMLKVEAMADLSRSQGRPDSDLGVSEN